MSEFVQPTLPGFPVRIVVSCTWEGPDRVACIRATTDVPSDLFTSMIDGSDVEGRFTPQELADAMSTLVYEMTRRLT